MTAPDAPSQVLQQWIGPRLVARLRDGLRAAAASAWTPLTIAIAASALILFASGGAVLMTRLEEIAASQRAAEIRAAPALEPAAGLQDFTLAPDAVRPISQDQARAFNSGIAFSTLPILAARPFILPPDRVEDYARALDCLTAAVYFEAASETTEGQQAVAQVVLNRMRHPAFPKTVCGVVFQGSDRATGCQFSFTCDGALARTPSIAGWSRARAVAASALNGAVAAGVGMATHYHTDWVAPYWAERLVKMRQIGAHIFYRWTGAWGLPGAFTGQHQGIEPVVAKLGALASPIEALDLSAPIEIQDGASEALPDVAPASFTPLSTPIVQVDVAQGEPAVTPPPAVDPRPTPVMQNPLSAPAAATAADIAAPRRSRLAVPH